MKEKEEQTNKEIVNKIVELKAIKPQTVEIKKRIQKLQQRLK